MTCQNNFLLSISFFYPDRAVCTWCEKYLDVHSSGLRKHQNSSKHILAAKRRAENLLQNDEDQLTDAAAATATETKATAAPAALVSEKAAISVICVSKSTSNQKASPEAKGISNSKEAKLLCI